MTNEQVERLKEINKSILKCTYCDFHRQLPQGFCFRPDAPILKEASYRHDYKIIAIGINPGWRDEYEDQDWQEVFKHNVDDYEGWVQKLMSQLERSKGLGKQRDPYAYGIAKWINLLIEKMIKAGFSAKDIRRELNIPTHTGIDASNVYEYVFWANQAFCNSTKPGVRRLKGIDIMCNTFGEEVPNCLKKGFLKDIVEIIGPKLLIFYGTTLYYKVLLQEILDVRYKNIHSDGPIEVETYRRSGKPVHSTFYCAKVTGVFERPDDLYAVFLTHPNARILNKAKSEAMEKICVRLKKSGFIL